jgi:hypothetical protein
MALGETIIGTPACPVVYQADRFHQLWDRCGTCWSYVFFSRVFPRSHVCLRLIGRSQEQCNRNYHVWRQRALRFGYGRLPHLEVSRHHGATGRRLQNQE